MYAIALSSIAKSMFCTKERKSPIGSRKFNRGLPAIYDYRLAVLKIVPNVQVSDTTKPRTDKFYNHPKKDASRYWLKQKFDFFGNLY